MMVRFFFLTKYRKADPGDGSIPSERRIGYPEIRALRAGSPTNVAIDQKADFGLRALSSVPMVDVSVLKCGNGKRERAR